MVLFCALILGTWAPGVAFSQELIAHAGLPIDTLTRTQAQLYFTMRLQEWPHRQPVHVFVLADSNPLHRRFAKQLLNLFPYQLRRVWDRQVFSGTGQAPRLVADEAEMIEQVAATPGAVGYVEAAPSDINIKPLAVR